MVKSLANRKARRGEIFREKWSIAKVLDIRDVMKLVLQDWLCKSHYFMFVRALPKSREEPLQDLVNSFVWTQTVYCGMHLDAAMYLVPMLGIQNVSSCDISMGSVEPFLKFTIPEIAPFLLSIQSLSLRCVKMLRLDLLAHLRLLKELTLEHTLTALSDTSPQYLAGFLPDLGKLVLERCEIDESVMLASDLLVRLTDFRVISCSVGDSEDLSIMQLLPYVTYFHPDDEWRQEDRDALEASVLSFDKLRTLHLPCTLRVENPSNSATAIIDRSPSIRCLDAHIYFLPSASFLPLQELELHHLVVSKVLLQGLAKYCPHLVAVTYDNCDYKNASPSGSVVETSDILPYFERLQSLSILCHRRVIGKIYDHLPLTQPYPNLRKVLFMCCDQKDLSFFASFLSLCPQLTSLHMHHPLLADIMTALSSNASQLTNLEELVLDHYEFTPMFLILYLTSINHAFPPIKRLVLMFCMISEVHAGFIYRLLDFFAPSLVSLTIQHCTGLHKWYRIIPNIARLLSTLRLRELVWEVEKYMPRQALQNRKDMLLSLFRECKEKVGFVLKASVHSGADDGLNQRVLGKSDDLLVTQATW